MNINIKIFKEDDKPVAILDVENFGEYKIIGEGNQGCMSFPMYDNQSGEKDNDGLDEFEMMTDEADELLSAVRSYMMQMAPSYYEEEY